MRLFPVIFAATQLVTTAAIAEPAALSGDTLKKAVSGKTVNLNVSGVNLPIRYSANGTMSGKVNGFVAAVAGEDRPSDSGKWWVKGDQLCQRWNSWLEKKPYCYKLTMNGGSVLWKRNDGRSGTATIG